MPLEKQSIYFAPANAEDDMYEGKYPMYFEGDDSLWQCLFAMLYKHVSLNLAICGEEYDKYIPAFVPVKTELTSRNYDYEGEELKGYLSLGTIGSLIKLFVASGKVYENQLRKIIIQYVLFLTIYYEKQFRAHVDGQIESENKEKQMVKKLDGVKKIIDVFKELPVDKPGLTNILAQVARDPLHYQKDLDIEGHQFTNYQMAEKLMDSFFRGLRDITLENCYIASFTDNCIDARMWHDYTNYEGIAIEYKDDESMMLRNAEGSTRKHKFRKVKYRKARGFNFFNSIGKLPVPMITGMFAKYDWKNDIYNIEANLKSHYWQWTEQTVLTKDYSWSTQRESRLIISDFIDGYSSVKSRTFFYDFSELKSVTFGPKTDDKNKVKIIKILSQKCEKNNVTNFPIYVVSRNDETGKMERELILKINRKSNKLNQ